MHLNAQVQIIVTGLGWMGGGVGSIDTALEQLVMQAQRELIVLTYSISDGADRLLQAVHGRLRAGVRVTLVVDHLANQHGKAPDILRQLARDYPSHCTLYDFNPTEDRANLHAKTIIADRE